MGNYYENLQVYKKALDLAVYFESIVRHFDKHFKYGIGADFCQLSRKALVVIAQANTLNVRQQKVTQAIEILEELKVLRYVDDFVLLSRDPEELRSWKDQIRQFLFDRLKLQLHPRRQKLEPVSAGIDFLGYIVRPGYTLVRRRVLNNLKAKIRELRKDPERLRQALASYLGHFRWADSYRLQQSLGLEGAK